MNNDNNLNQMPTQPVAQPMPNQQQVQQPMQQPQPMPNPVQQPETMPINQPPMQGQPQPMNNVPPKKKNNNLIILIIVAVIVAILVFVVVTAVTSKSKDKDKTNDTNQTEEKNDNEDKDNDQNKEDDENEENESTVLDGDWKTMKFSFDGKTYTLMSNFSEISKNGWTLDTTYLEGDSLESMYKTYTSISLVNPKYSDSDISVGLINKTDAAKKYEDCEFWSISVSNEWIDTPVDFSLPGGVKYGSTLAEIEAVYGKPETDNIYRSETLKYYEYTYETDDIVLDLTIYDETGLMEFNYKYYG